MRPTLMLLPGLLCDATPFAVASRLLAPHADVQIPNFYGLDTISAMAARVLAQAPPRFALAGFSMGGRVAFEVMRQAGDRVSHFCVFDTSALPAAEGEAAKRQVLVDLGYAKGMEAVCDAWLPPMVHPDRLADTALMDPLRAMVARVSPDVFARQIQALVTRPDPRPVLATITCPSLVMCGAQDAWSPPAQAQAIAHGIAGAKLTIIEQAGHFLPTEQPMAFTQALIGWLNTPTEA